MGRRYLMAAATIDGSDGAAKSMGPSALALIVLLSAAAGPASAYKFSPPATAFTLSGPASVTILGKITACTVTAIGATSANGRRVAIQSFYSNTAGCALRGVNLPWTIYRSRVDTAVIENFSYTYSSGQVVCGPKNGRASVDAGGVWSFTFTQGGNNNCSVQGSALASIPPVTIVP